MKKCPKCGMVHADADFMCRRCRVDLLTGEPVKVRLAPQSGGSVAAAKALTALAPKILNKLGDTFGALKKKAAGLIPKRFTETKPLAPTVSAQVGELIYCLQCGGEMKPATLRYFPGKVLYPFLGLALVLIILGFWWWGLFITATLSIAGFFAFRSLKVNLWKCGECNYELKRDRARKAQTISK